MAGDWIKMRTALYGDDAVIGISNTLNVSRFAVVGMLYVFWCWAQDQTVDGHTKFVTPTNVNDIIGVNGFAEALIAHRWLRVTKGKILVPNFDRHLSDGAKTRVEARERQRQSRNRRDTCHTEDVTKAQLEKRREEKSKKNPPTPQRGDPSTWAFEAMTGKTLKTEAFWAAWADWAKHRAEIKKPLKPSMVKAQIRQFESWGLARALTAINHTICKGWQGIREPNPADIAADVARSKTPWWLEETNDKP